MSNTTEPNEAAEATEPTKPPPSVLDTVDQPNEAVEAVQRQKNIRLGLLLGAFVLMIIIGSIVNFYYSGLPQDPNRMRERDKQIEAARAQRLSEALQKSDKIQDKQLKTTSEEVE